MRHRRYYTDWAERAAPRLRRHDQRTWLRRLDAEAANLRAMVGQGLAAAQELGDPQAVAQALTGLAGARALGGQPGPAARMLERRTRRGGRKRRTIRPATMPPTTVPTTVPITGASPP